MGDWKLWLTSAVIAAVVAAIARLVELPKNRGEGKQATATADGKRFDTYKATTDATIANLENDCKRCTEKVDNLQQKHDAMELKFDQISLTGEALADAVEALVDNPSGIPERQHVRLRLREFRQAL